MATTYPKGPANDATPVLKSQDVKLYPLTEEELHEAEENMGYGEHCGWYEIECAGVHINARGCAVAVYTFRYLDTNEDRWDTGTVYVTVRDGKRYAEF